MGLTFIKTNFMLNRREKEPVILTKGYPANFCITAFKLCMDMFKETNNMSVYFLHSNLAHICLN